MSKYDLIIGGGADDFNLTRLMEIASQRGVKTFPLVHRADSEPSLIWRLEDRKLIVDGSEVSAPSLFLRYDVFTGQQNPDNPAQSAQPTLDRGMGWYTALNAWGMSDPKIRLFNRDIHHQAGLKPFTLTSAVAKGLKIPDSLISNDEKAIKALPHEAIVKPVAGGSYTRTLEKALSTAQIENGLMPVPATIQRKLAYPEYRTFVIGREFHVFRIISQYLDYRPVNESTMDYIAGDFPCQDTAAALVRLLDLFDCDFCACDFKTDPDTGAPVFLELNNGPMFAAFDITAGGKLCEAMLDWLLDTQ